MTIDVFTETILTLAEASNKLPAIGQGKRVHVSCIYRWAHNGVQREDGARVRLETVKIGGRLCTSQESLQRFFDRLQENQQIIEPPSRGIIEPLPLVQQPRSVVARSRDREQRIRNAERELRMGGMDGDARVFETFSGSKEKLCDLHEFLHAWMPSAGVSRHKAFLTVRSGIFKQAAQILAGKCPGDRGFEAAQRWIKSLDLAVLDVSSLNGVGPMSAGEWNSLLKLPEMTTLIEIQRQQREIKAS